MTFTQLEIFALVADLGGFTAAGLRLGISQSAVSHAIRSLEQELEVELLLRSQGAAELTPVGQRLLARAREILGLSEAMRQEAAAARGLHHGVVRIGSFGPTASLNLLPAILDAFTARYPRIEVQVDEGSDLEVVNWIQDRRVDLGFVAPPVPSFDTVDLAEDEFLALLPPGHRLARRAAVAANCLRDDIFIMSSSGCDTVVEQAFAAQGLNPQVRHRMAQVITILGMVQSGYGVSVLPQLALPSGLASSHPGVTALPFEPSIRRKVGLALRDLRRATPAARAFIDVAVQAVKTNRPGAASHS